MSRRTRNRTLAGPARKSRVTPAPIDARPIPKVRLWVFRLLFWLGPPFVFFVGLEIILRLVGFGYPTSFFLPARINGREMMVQNDRFGWPYFGPDLAREPFPLAISKSKPPETVRVFVFGESAAYGDPQPDFGLARILEALLSQRYPSRHFEIVNVAMTAINSHAILPIARDCARQSGDIWVIYMGNNEVVGPFGTGTVFGPGLANLTLIRCSLALKATRTGQLLARLVRRLHPRSDLKREWGGMAMFLGNQVRQDDSRMQSVYKHFKANLDDTLDAGRRAGAHVILSTVASNLKDCAPFASLHAPGLPDSTLNAWNRLYQQALDAEHAGRPSEAIEPLSQAAQLDNGYAALHYLWGRCCLALSRDTEALTHFTRARDLDTLRFRADSRINQLIREAAASHGKQGVQLIDAEKKLGEQSSRGLLGDQFFYEHVHLNFQGNYSLALAMAEEVARVMPEHAEDHVASGRGWASAAECAQRLAWTRWSRYEGMTAILGRISDPPFTAQLNHAEQYGKLRHELDTLAGASSQTELRQDVQSCQAASAAFPTDWVLRKELARAQEKLGDFAGAAASWRKILAALPHYTEAWQQLGRDLADQNQEPDAISALQQALRLDPTSVVTLSTLADIQAHQGKMAESIQNYESALRIKPYWSQAHVGLGKVLEAAGRPQEADRHFRQALENRMYTPAALNALGRLCFEKGWFSEAATNFTDSLKLNPFDASAHVNLGVTLLQLGRHSEAAEHFAEALKLDPSLAEAHVRLGFELGRQGHDAEAATHFAEAVRLKPSLLEARLDLGIALLKQQRNAEALEQFNEVLRQDPKNPTALKNIQRLSGKPSQP